MEDGTEAALTETVEKLDVLAVCDPRLGLLLTYLLT